MHRFMMIAFALAALAALAAPAADPPPVPDDAVEFGGHRYQLFDEVEDLSWQKGRDECVRLGATLAVVSTAEEADFIAELCDDRYMYLGASDDEVEGEWVWVDGTPWSFSRWLDGQPNDYRGREDFLATYDDGEWVDVDASGGGFWMPTGYICEWAR